MKTDFFKNRWCNIVLILLAIIYVAIVLKLTIFRGITYIDRQLNLTLFTELISVYKNRGLWQYLRLFLGNIGWFMPFGFFLPMFLKRENMIKIAICGLGFSFAIEILQFVFKKGIAEIDDLILNTIGTIIGYLFYSVYFSFYKNSLRRKSGLL